LIIDGANGSDIPPIQVYDPVTGSWSLRPRDPVGRAEAAAGVINQKIYVAEGWLGSDANNATAALEIFDPATNSWTAGASSLVARGESASAVIRGKLYITGGNAKFNDGDIATLEIYDPVTNTWSLGAPMPIASESAVGAAINGRFYVAGGAVRAAGGGPAPATADLYIYDPASDTWTSGAPMPSARDTAAGGVVNGKLYVTGGASTNGANNPVVTYSPATDSWALGVAEPTPRVLGTAVGGGGMLFVAGGYPNDIPPATATAEILTR